MNTDEPTNELNLDELLDGLSEALQFAKSYEPFYAEAMLLEHEVVTAYDELMVLLVPVSKKAPTEPGGSISFDEAGPAITRLMRARANTIALMHRAVEYLGEHLHDDDDES